MGSTGPLMPPTPGACSKTQGFALSPVSAELTREGPCYFGTGRWGGVTFKVSLLAEITAPGVRQPGSQPLSRACRRMHSRPPWGGSCSQESPAHPDLSDLQTLPQPSVEPASWSLFAQLGWSRGWVGRGCPLGPEALAKYP